MVLRCHLANSLGMANRIKDVRLKAGMTQEGLAELSGVSVGHISKIEKGHRGLTLENLIAFARALNADPLDLSNDFLPEDIEVAMGVPSRRRVRRGDVPQFDNFAGLGGGGLLEIPVDGDGLALDESQIRGFWSFPEYVKAGWRHLKKIYAVEVLGDSMEPTLPGGSFVFVDTSHTFPNPSDIYAIDYGEGLMVKRVELVPKEETIHIISDNDRYSDHTLRRDEVTVHGRVVAWFQWRG